MHFMGAIFAQKEWGCHQVELDRVADRIHFDLLFRQEQMRRLFVDGFATLIEHCVIRRFVDSLDQFIHTHLYTSPLL